MLLISADFCCCITWSIFVIFFADLVLLIKYISIYVKHKQAKEVNIMFILSLICFIFDILSLLGLFLNNNDPDDCFRSCFKKSEEKHLENIRDQIYKIKIENNNLQEENKKLIDLRNKRITSKIEDKKIEVILWYIKNKYNKIFSPNILYQYLLDEIKEKCGIIIDKNKLRDIYI